MRSVPASDKEGHAGDTKTLHRDKFGIEVAWRRPNNLGYGVGVSRLMSPFSWHCIFAVLSSHVLKKKKLWNNNQQAHDIAGRSTAMELTGWRIQSWRYKMPELGKTLVSRDYDCEEINTSYHSRCSGKPTSVYHRERSTDCHKEEVHLFWISAEKTPQGTKMHRVQSWACSLGTETVFSRSNRSISGTFSCSFF